MANIFEQKGGDELTPTYPSGQTMTDMESGMAAASGKTPLPGQRKNPDMAVVSVKRPRFGFDY